MNPYLYVTETRLLVYYKNSSVPAFGAYKLNINPQDLLSFTSSYENYYFIGYSMPSIDAIYYKNEIGNEAIIYNVSKSSPSTVSVYLNPLSPSNDTKYYRIYRPNSNYFISVDLLHNSINIISATYNIIFTTVVTTYSL